MNAEHVFTHLLFDKHQLSVQDTAYTDSPVSARSSSLNTAILVLCSVLKTPRTCIHKQAAFITAVNDATSHLQFQVTCKQCCNKGI